jgi:N-acetylmuramoyl-L-alanine amidase
MTARNMKSHILDCLPAKFGCHPVVARQWLPKSKPLPQGPVTSRTGKLVTGFSQIVIGDSGSPGLTAAAAAMDLGQAYGHFLIDDNSIIECVPALTSSVGIVEQARFVETRTSAGELDAHENTMAINLCFGGDAGGAVGYRHCIALVAFACHRFDLDPLKHVKRAGDLDPARKDPDRALKAAESDFEQLKTAIAKLYEATKPPPTKSPAAPEAAHA